MKVDKKDAFDAATIWSVADVSPSMVLADAFDILAQARLERVAVRDGETICGVLQESDLIRHVSQHGGWATEPVSSIMRDID